MKNEQILTEKKIGLSQYCLGRTYVFVDAANIFYSQNSLDWKVRLEVCTAIKELRLRRVPEGFLDKVYQTQASMSSQPNIVKKKAKYLMSVFPDVYSKD